MKINLDQPFITFKAQDDPKWATCYIQSLLSDTWCPGTQNLELFINKKKIDWKEFGKDLIPGPKIIEQDNWMKEEGWKRWEKILPAGAEIVIIAEDEWNYFKNIIIGENEQEVMKKIQKVMKKLLKIKMIKLY